MCVCACGRAGVRACVYVHGEVHALCEAVNRLRFMCVCLAENDL